MHATISSAYGNDSKIFSQHTENKILHQISLQKVHSRHPSANW